MIPTFQRGKLRDFNILLESTKLLPHIPETRLFTKEFLEQMINTHPTLYIKPDAASQGHGIIRIDRTERAYTLRAIDTNHSSTQYNTHMLWRNINRLKRKQAYIIQQGIDSRTQFYYPFDIRIHVVKVNESWVLGGMVAKVAKKRSIVTNACQGATPTHIDTVLKMYRGLDDETSTALKDKMKEIALGAAQEMVKKHPEWKEFGLDVGIDTNNHIWIYEVNFRPGFILFRNIDQPAYLHICSLRKQLTSKGVTV